jgi:nitrilase
MAETRVMRVAAVQATPVLLDRAATTERVVALTGEAASNGAELIVFPETFVPGYPDWVWHLTPWGRPSGDLYQRLLDQSVRVPGPTTAVLGDAARRAGAYLAVGINEVAGDGSTIYNSLLYLDPDGEVIGVHRKLMPTGGERLVHGQGDGSGLISFETPGGRVGGLICWENYMPLARVALYSQGIDIYLAPTWDNSDVWVPTLRHIAREGRCYVIGTNTVQRGSDIAAEDLGLGEVYGDMEWVSQGNACIVGPDGSVLAGPLHREAGILYAAVDRIAVGRQRLQFDACGHYARDDVFRLLVDYRPRVTVAPTAEDGRAAPAAPVWDDPGSGSPPA